MSKPTGKRWWLRNKHELNSFLEHVHGLMDKGEYPTVQFLAADRTTKQNTFFYALYRDIANQMEDRSIVEVKRDCKLRYGVAIRKGADPEWAEWYDSAVKPMTFEQKLYLMDDYPITSEFTKAQATEYIDTIIADYTRQGFNLQAPQA